MGTFFETQCSFTFRKYLLTYFPCAQTVVYISTKTERDIEILTNITGTEPAAELTLTEYSFRCSDTIGYTGSKLE